MLTPARSESVATGARTMGPSLGLLVALAIVVALAGCGENTAKPVANSAPEVTFKPKEMADALHAVIAADREIYSVHVVQRLAAGDRTLKASEHWQQDNTLPLPAQVLKMGSEAVQQKGAEFHYILRSLWPLNPKNGPETPTEKKGLQEVLEHPDANYYAEESLGGRRYFTAVYADRASVASCVECHNTHPVAQKKDFKQGDVMGGLIVRVPLEF
jgi:hypothetical protein